MTPARPTLPATPPTSEVPGTATHWSSSWGFDVETRLYADKGQRVVVLSHGAPGAPGVVPLVRIHSACLTSEVFGSTRCDCREQLDEAMRRIGVEGAGLLLYFLDHEGRGIGLEAKLQAYALQDDGHDTTKANHLLGHPADARVFSAAAHVLAELGIRHVRLLTNNPAKIAVLEDAGIQVDRVPAWVKASRHAQGYLHHKRTVMAHLQ